MTKRASGHVTDRGRDGTIVVGASLAGLFAAAAAANAGHRVTLLERDRLPTGPEPRRGVPQGEQTHVLLHRGLLSAERLLPGLHDELLRRGAPEFPVGRIPLLSQDGWVPRGDYGYPVVCLSRVLLEHVVRERVLALPGVRVREQVRVRSLHREGSGPWHVTLEPSGSTSAHDGADVLTADVVVDASGRSSRMPAWLRDLGVPEARTTSVDAQVGYATRRFTSSRPPGPGVIVLSSPSRPRGAMVSPVEDGQWQVTAVGRGAHRPGRDPGEFLEHLRGLSDPLAFDMVQDMTPVGDVSVHRQTANVRHHYGHRGWPGGLLVVGDALCALNPVYGSGITVAARQALVLQTCLARSGRRAVTGRLQRRVARAADLPWTMATSQDRQLVPAPGRPRPVEAVVGWWGAEVARLAAQGDLRAANALQAVTHLVAHPVTLFTPALLLAGVRSRRRRSPYRDSPAG